MSGRHKLFWFELPSIHFRITHEHALEIDVCIVYIYAHTLYRYTLISSACGITQMPEIQPMQHITWIKKSLIKLNRRLMEFWSRPGINCGMPKQYV